MRIIETLGLRWLFLDELMDWKIDVTESDAVHYINSARLRIEAWVLWFRVVVRAGK